MDEFIGFTRYMLPALALIILAKCVMTLLLGHPVNKTYGYIIDRVGGEKIPLNTWETSIGRSNSCDITIGYDTVSRYQAVISRRPDGWYIFDTMSRSGTKVNGEKIDRRAVIKHGDTLVFGDKLFTFAVADDPVIQVGKRGKRKAQASPEAAPLPPSYAANAVSGEVRPRYFDVQNPGARIKPIADDEKFAINIGKTEDNVPIKPIPKFDSVFSDANKANQPKREPAIRNLDTGETYVLCGSEIIVGRGRGCDINLPGMTVSRRHALLKKFSDGWGVEDAGSKHGTTLNGKAIKMPQLLFDGDVLGFAEFRFKFYSDYKQGK